jgi:hypothetical protein
MRRRDLLRRAGLGPIAAAALPSLLQLTASPVSAQAVPAPAAPAPALDTDFYFTGLSSAGRVGGVEHWIAATGNGAIGGTTADGGGAFTHYDNLGVGLPKPILASGTWRATRLVSYKQVGTYGTLAAGVADLEVVLERVEPSPGLTRGRLRIVSNLSPAGMVNGEPSGYTLTIAGGPAPFRQLPAAGMTVFSKIGVASGTEAPAASTSGAALMPQAGVPENAIHLEPGKTLAGRLAVGQPDGQFAYYKIEYPGDDAPHTIDLNIFPDQHNLLLNAGFLVYGPDPTRRLYARGTPQHQHRPNVTADFRSTEAGTYTIQVYNYDPALPMDFEIRAST